MKSDLASIAIIVKDTLVHEHAINVASQLNVPVLEETSSFYDFHLVFSSEKIWIQPSRMHFGKIYVDFTTGQSAHRRKYGGGFGQALAKAVGLNKDSPLDVMDVTGGYARDAFVLATLGATLRIIERSRVLTTLVQDGLDRAQTNKTVNKITQRMSLICADSIIFMQELVNSDKPDVIYLDPMYPIRQKKSAVKKEIQLLHQLIGRDTDSKSLLQAAFRTAKKRVVVKRPKSAEPLSKINLVGSIRSSNTRYDIYNPEFPGTAKTKV